MIASTLTIPVTPVQVACAQFIAQNRCNGHADTRKAHEDLGSSYKNRWVDVVGCLGEIIVYHTLEAVGILPEGYILSSNKAPSGADFSLNGIRYDIKTIPVDVRYLSVNERKRLSAQHAFDYILPVALGPGREVRIYAPIAASVLATWQLREGHSPYRSVSIEKLEPLKDIKDLLAYTGSAQLIHNNQ